MNNTFFKEIELIKTSFSEYKLPRWDELPEIDFYMDQVIEFTEKHLSLFLSDESGKLISPSIVNNYVKNKIIPPPIKKRYSREHIAFLLIICILKPIMPISSIQILINSRIQNKPLEEIYNNFCDEQEASLGETINMLNADVSLLIKSEEDLEESLSNLTIKRAIVSNSNKIITNKLLYVKTNNSNK